MLNAFRFLTSKAVVLSAASMARRNLFADSERYCLWIEDQYLQEAMQIEAIKTRIDAVKLMRLASRDKSANEMATRRTR